MFAGLCAFPITPVNETTFDEKAFSRLVERCVAARVDSVCALGSTGNYLYLTREERARVIEVAVGSAKGFPVIAGISALRTRDVLLLADDALRYGASGVLLAPASYHQLSAEEVFQHFQLVARHSPLPLCVYDNPGATRFDFSDALHARIADLPNVRSIKIPPVSMDLDVMRNRVARLRDKLPASVSIGISGDRFAAVGLASGCDVWYSVIGGIFPRTSLALLRAVQSHDEAEVARMTDNLAPLWGLFDKYRGSLRVVAAAASLMGIAQAPSLPLPLRSIDSDDVEVLAELIDQMQLS